MVVTECFRAVCGFTDGSEGVTATGIEEGRAFAEHRDRPTDTDGQTATTVKLFFPDKQACRQNTYRLRTCNRSGCHGWTRWSGTGRRWNGTGRRLSGTRRWWGWSSARRGKRCGAHSWRSWCTRHHHRSHSRGRGTWRNGAMVSGVMVNGVMVNGVMVYGAVVT